MVSTFTVNDYSANSCTLKILTGPFEIYGFTEENWVMYGLRGLYIFMHVVIVIAF